MRSMRALWLLVATLSACRFSIDSVDIGTGGPRDMAGPRLDLTGVIQDLSSVDAMMCGGLSCPFGCVLTPSPHCKTLQPSGVVTASDYGAAGLMTAMPTSDVTFNTDTGQVTGGITRAAGPGVAGGIGYRLATQGTSKSVGIFSFSGFKLPAGTTMKFTGGSAFALAASGDVSIAGTIRAGCSSGTPGPGGDAGGTLSVANGLGNGIGGGTGGGAMGGGAAGGGGAGYGDIGGTGAAGQGTPSAPAGIIWPLLQPSSGTLVLVGGSGGGAGGGNGGGAGGGGGGAVQLSVNGTITISGIIDVSGCGGSKTSNNNSGGGGGGSGGAIVLEAGSVVVTNTATLSSNGGGGGGGGDNNNSGNGSDGAPGATAASGGAAGGGGGGGGGAGGARGAQAGVGNTQGTNAPQSPLVPGIKFGGGGGGGTGRILLRALTVKDQAMIVSPDPSDRNRNNERITVYDTATFQ